MLKSVWLGITEAARRRPKVAGPGNCCIPNPLLPARRLCSWSKS
jgi:hypothetical protein